MGRVEQHHDLMVKMTKSRVHFAQLRQVRMQLHRYSQSTNTQQSENSSDEVNSRVPRIIQSYNNVNQTIDDATSSNDSDDNI